MGPSDSYKMTSRLQNKEWPPPTGRDAITGVPLSTASADGVFERLGGWGVGDRTPGRLPNKTSELKGGVSNKAGTIPH